MVHDSYSNFHYYMLCFLTNFDVSNLTFSKQPRNVEFRHANIPLMFHLHSKFCLKSFSWHLNALVGCFTLLYIISKMYLYPDGYGPAVIVGFFIYYIPGLMFPVTT